jgi:hypothetical protein
MGGGLSSWVVSFNIIISDPSHLFHAESQFPNFCGAATNFTKGLLVQSEQAKYLVNFEVIKISWILLGIHLIVIGLVGLLGTGEGSGWERSTVRWSGDKSCGEARKYSCGRLRVSIFTINEHQNRNF